LAGFLQAAAELFSEIGFEAATMQAIADRSKSSSYLEELLSKKAQAGA
jgi:hypothetical protein